MQPKEPTELDKIRIVMFYITYHLGQRDISANSNEYIRGIIAALAAQCYDGDSYYKRYFSKEVQDAAVAKVAAMFEYND